MKDAFSTSAGKLILNSAVDMITSNVIAIVNICRREPPEKAKEMIIIPANEISIADKMLKKWSDIMTKGDEHSEKL